MLLQKGRPLLHGGLSAMQGSAMQGSPQCKFAATNPRAMFRNIILSPRLHLALLLLIPVAMILLPVEWIDGPGVPVCIFRNLTGYECWGCGLTRAMVSVMHLELHRAWEFNPLIVVVFPLALWYWVVSMRRTVLRLRERDRNPPA